MKSIFLVTSRIYNSHQAFLLKTCISSIKEHNKDSDIVILNDYSSSDYFSELQGIRIETVKYRNGGEINAYVWACEHSTEYDRFIYIHDSTMVLSTIPIEMPENTMYRSMWYSHTLIHHDCFGADQDSIVSKFSLDISKFMKEIKEGDGVKGNLVFGAMGVFTSEFAKRLATETNFLEIANLFNRRELRCFFERFICCVVASFQSWDKFRENSLCGTIIEHGHAFKTRSPDPSLANNKYLVKSWQER